MSRELDAALHFFFLLAGIIIFVRGYRHLPLYLKLVGGYLIVTFIADLMAVAIMFNRKLAAQFEHNLFIYHFLTPIQYTFIALIYYNLIVDPIKKKWLLLPFSSFYFFRFYFPSSFKESMTTIPMLPYSGIS